MDEEWITYGRSFEQFVADMVNPVGFVVRYTVQFVNGKTRNEQKLIGDVSRLAGSCDHCLEIRDDQIIDSYKQVYFDGKDNT